MKNLKFILICFLVLIIALTGCSNKEMKANENNNDKVTLRLPGGDWGYPSPYLHYTRGPGAFKMALIFDSLLEKDEDGLISWLSKDWKISDDGKEYNFKLNENVKWHDGKKFTAEDVKFTFDYYKKHPPVWNELIVNGTYIIKETKILDENTIKVIVNEKNATYLERLGTMKILPKHIWENVEDPKKFNSKKSVIGCGPYKLTGYSKEQGTYKFEAFNDYWGFKHKVDVIKFVPVSDKVLAFENKEVDTLMAPPDILDRYKGKDEYKIYDNKPFWGYRLIFNMKKRPILKNKNVRLSFAYGIDRKELIEKIARASGVIGSMGYLPKDHIWYNDDVKKYSLNLDKAKELLDGKKYEFEILVGNSKDEVKIAELMKISLKRIGINLKIKSVDKKTRDGMVKNNNYELAIIGHGGWGNDADMLREIYYSSKTLESNSPASGTLPGFYNEKINELSIKQMKEFDREKRKEIIFKLQRLISLEVPQIPLYNKIGHLVFRPSKYDGWMYTYDHHYPEHCKLSYLERE
ncbi:MAG: diguanylate phosphodiesterase [Firmicutes bacterium]|nr:diguanylate phosphodiesterase [Bacillota bacterium]